MSLERDQFKACVEILIPHMNTPPEDRQAFVTGALYGSVVLDKLTWNGNARTFSTNLVRNLDMFDETTSLIAVLEALRGELGEPKASEITRLINDLIPSATEALPATSGINSPPSMDAQVFISYSRQDVAFVDHLRGDLGKQGIPYWIDKEGLTPGTRNWERSIREAIQHSRAVLWVVSPSSYESEYVNSEIAVAEMYARKIFPVWANGDNWIACVPLGKHNIQFVDMRGADYERGLWQLIPALGGAGTTISIEPEAGPEPVANPENPYTRLYPFGGRKGKGKVS